MIYNELQWTLMSDLAAIAEIAVSGYFYVRLAKPFLKNKRGIFCT